MAQKKKTNYVFRFNMIMFCLILGFVCWKGVETQSAEMSAGWMVMPGERGYDYAKADQDRLPNALPKGVIWLPDPSRRVFVGPQLSVADFRALVKAHPEIKSVVRLNLEKKSLEVMDTTAERSLLAAHGVAFHPFNIEARGESLNDGVLQQIDAIVDAGGVYVHCLHGQHRAKAIAGRFLARQGYRKTTVYDLLNWWPVVKDEKYARYVRNVRREIESQSK